MARKIELRLLHGRLRTVFAPVLCFLLPVSHMILYSDTNKSGVERTEMDVPSLWLAGCFVETRREGNKEKCPRGGEEVKRTGNGRERTTSLKRKMDIKSTTTNPVLSE